MSKYTGSQCIICQNLFQDGDDIVVCPDCGTPYHRSCYTSAGRCVNDALHASSRSWQQQQDAVREKLGGQECPVCRHTNEPGARRCGVCGSPLIPEGSPTGRPGVTLRMPDGNTFFYDGTDPTCGLPKDELFEEERLEDVANFVRDNALIHLFNFKKFKETGKKIALNIWALAFPHLYFAYRKMWLYSILVIVISAVLGIPGLMSSLYLMLTDKDQQALLGEFYSADMLEMFAGAVPFLEAHESQLTLLGDVCYFLSIAMRIALLLFTNFLYYRFVLKKVKKIRLASISDYDRKRVLRAEGGVSFWNVLGALALYFVITTAVGAMVLMPFMTVA